MSNLSANPAPMRARPPRARVAAVVVAYNRAELLAECLDGLHAQSHPLDAIVVIDNCSTDDSAARAAEHPAQPTVISLPRNTGGAGGFAAGMAHVAAHLNVDWVWLMDDDTIPTEHALRELVLAAETYPGRVRALGSRAIWTDGRTHPMNVARVRPLASPAQRAAARRAGGVPVRSTSFVSCLIAMPVVRYFGLPRADYFIWNDDFEYTARILRDGVGLQVPASIVEHRTAQFGSSKSDPGERFYYEVRNKIWTFARSRDFDLIDLVLYGASTLVGWAKVLARSPHRGTLLAAGGKGLADAVAAPPEPNAEVLSGLGEISAAVDRVEGGVRYTGGRRGH